MPAPLRQYGLFGAVLLLCVIVIVPRAWGMMNAVAPARDAIRYWAGADLLLQKDFVQAIQSMEASPLYPFSLAVLKWFGLGNSPEGWWRATQVWSIACYLAFMLSAFWVGHRLLGSTIAWWGCVFVSLLPRQIRYSIDVLADNLNAALLMGAVVFLFSVKRSLLAWTIAGVLTSLAFLTRPESLVLPIAVVAAFMGQRLLRSSSWGGESRKLALYLAPIFIVVASYGKERGELTPGNTGRGILGQATRVERAPIASPTATIGSFKTPVDAWMPTSEASSATGRISIQSGRIGVSILRALWELGQETRVWIALLACLGFVLAPLAAANVDKFALLLWWISGTLLLAVVCRWQAGFVAGRYLMPILPIFGMYAAAGIRELASRSLSLAEGNSSRRERWGWALAGTLALFLSLPAWREPLHADRAGHQQAAQWLREHTSPGEEVFDPAWMSAFFSGRPFAIPSPESNRSVRYGVLDSALVASPPAALATTLHWASQGEVVASFFKRPGSSQVGVRIVRLPSSMAEPMMK